MVAKTPRLNRPNMMTPAQFYHRLRRRYAPTFQPRHEVETTYWETFATLCQDNNWDPYGAIERTYQYIAWLLANNAAPRQLEKGYPTLNQLTNTDIVAQAYDAELRTKHRENPFRYVPYAEASISSQLRLLSIHSINNNETLESIAGKNPEFLIWPVLCLVLNPKLRTKPFSPQQTRILIEHGKDPTVWVALATLGLSPKAIQDTRRLIEGLPTVPAPAVTGPANNPAPAATPA